MIWAFLYDTDIHTAVNGCLTAASLYSRGVTERYWTDAHETK